MSDVANETVDSLATEHILCLPCQESISTSRLLQSPSKGSEDFRQYFDYDTLESSSKGGCHLCSLFLGRVRQHNPIIGSITVTLQVSRSGGMTLLLRAGETAISSKSLGDLAILPAEDVEDTTIRTDAPFSFSSTTNFVDAHIAKSLASEATFSLAREWLHQCLQGHDKCMEAAGAGQTKVRPSRLIDVGADGRDPKVVTTQGLNDTEPVYLTLSHCWGGADILRLLVENLDSLTVGIPMSALPTTFQDSIHITRKLGYQYIWIDSLCIIQNSISDWRICSAIMGEIYANSICTIAALTARNSNEGCFFDYTRNPLFFRPCRITDGWYLQANRDVGVDLRMGLSPLPLHTRAWVVQERILAPRTLYYGSTGLAWECIQCSATEAVPWGEVSRFSPKASFFSINLESVEEIYDFWTDVQISYTRCLLTRFDDRLVAISGVIKRIETLTGWTNVWGLWRERMLEDILWFVDEPTRRPKTNQYLAPTWSWVGVEGRVMMAIGSPERRRWMAEVIDVGTAEGQGYVRFRASMRKVKCTANRLTMMNVGMETPGPIWEVDWDPDVSPTADNLGKELWCLLVARLPEYLGGVEAFDIGLVLAPRGTEWMRLGVFRQLRQGNNLFPEDSVVEGTLAEVVIV
ncbi:hypothetical protein PAXINDRAFT_115801 [Paxillus involutus ATCC 200175]|uniref:Heterokaryon incompatibility domain-containing protein n=1 Tax=Paxillus involutus ATCC 200175 TaxID=664439 RepID=A0A0C9U4W0_PAXIN|nr:hypothetical protein PAXINDRAFT_115801 [Paxillus involutus ATCC 200175]